MIPCYNEQAVLPKTAPLFLGELEEMVKVELISPESKICFVDDGSDDRTWKIICQLSEANAVYQGISLSRNRGHQNALLAGLMEARGNCDACISMDCDGQDDIAASRKMVQEYLGGSEIVYGVRSSRDTDTAFKRMTAEGFYKVLNSLGAEVVFNHADYRLLSEKALDCLAEYTEVNLYLRGLVPMIGLESSQVAYERHSRIAGESHYPLSKMINLAVTGVTNLSTKPLELLSKAGLFFSAIGLVGIIWAVCAMASGNAVAGWASVVCILCFFGGINLFAIGVLGVYVGKIYLEVKNRPRFVVSKRTWDK